MTPTCSFRKVPFITVLLMRAVLVLAAFPAHSAENLPPAGFTPLFNGTDLNGWWGAETENPELYLKLPPADFKAKQEASLADVRSNWRVENGELVNDGKGVFLTSNGNYGDFELFVDYKTVPRADSGIYLRGCPQVQIWDSSDADKFKFGAHKGSGGLWNNHPDSPGRDPLVKADKPFGEWNRFRIIMAGSRVWVWLNGQPTIEGEIMENYFDRKLPIPRSGPIQLQTHGGEIRWRNLFIREIGGDEANQLLRGANDDGFKTIFNGKDFSGWAGPVDQYEIKDGAIICKRGKGGTIYTAGKFTDFTVRLEFKLPPGGNNGLAIRYPGAGDPAYLGMCESQILDDDYEKITGQKLDPRQVHGSAYGMAGAIRGFQRPTGQWNFQEVTVRGSTIKVELNGSIILDADLGKITDYADGRAHPGKDLKDGHFGFAGHHDPVMFRNLSVKSTN